MPKGIIIFLLTLLKKLSLKNYASLRSNIYYLLLGESVKTLSRTNIYFILLIYNNCKNNCYKHKNNY